MTYDDFFTDSYKKWVMGKNTPIDDNLSGYITRDQKLVLFELDRLIELKDDFAYVLVHSASEKKYQEFLKMNIKHNKRIWYSPMYRCGPEFFSLKGKKYKNIRNGRNKWEKEVVIESKPRFWDDIKQIIMLWREQSESRYFRMFTSNEWNFINTHIQHNFNNYITYCYYICDKIVGCSIYEHIRDDLFLSLFRKSDVSYPKLSNYIDYRSFHNVYDKYGEFFINIGDDGGRENLRKFKIQQFDVHKEFIVYSMIIDNRVKERKPKIIF